MCRINSSLVLVAGGCVALASSAFGQAPSTAQVWDVRFVLDSTGPYVPGPSSTQVGITMYGRVGILPNTSATGTNNFGISRVGRQLFRMTIQDAFSANTGSRQGVLALGRTEDITGEPQADTNGALSRDTCRHSAAPSRRRWGRTTWGRTALRRTGP